MHYFLLYLFLINAAGLAFMLADKSSAAKKGWRIPERTLIGTALMGGSIGCILGMLLFRHKTRHLKFALGLPVILVLQAVLGFWLFRTLQ